MQEENKSSVNSTSAIRHGRFAKVTVTFSSTWGLFLNSCKLQRPLPHPWESNSFVGYCGGGTTQNSPTLGSPWPLGIPDLFLAGLLFAQFHVLLLLAGKWGPETLGTHTHNHPSKYPFPSMFHLDGWLPIFATANLCC